jgi:hypothetical protein
MSRFAALVHVLPFSVGLLTGCTTLVTSYNMVRAEIMNSQEPKDESQNYYGAFFISAASLASGRPTEGSEPILRQYPEAKGRLSRRMLPPGVGAERRSRSQTYPRPSKGDERRLSGPTLLAAVGTRLFLAKLQMKSISPGRTDAQHCLSKKFGRR